ncbi:MAG TPA: hypothetical protein VID51_02450 [Solirubrobacterales bacterium]
MLREAVSGVWKFIKQHFFFEVVVVVAVTVISYWLQHKAHWMDRAVHSLMPTGIVLGAALFLIALIQLIDAPARLLRTQHARSKGTTLEIEELTGSVIEAGSLEQFTKVQIAKASDCNFKTDAAQK